MTSHEQAVRRAIRAQMAAYSAGLPSLIKTATSLRADYIRGHIEIDEYEAQLDALLAQDPEALDRPDKHDLAFHPGAAIPIDGDPRDAIWPQSAKGHELRAMDQRRRLISHALHSARRQGLSHHQTAVFLRTVLNATNSNAARSAAITGFAIGGVLSATFWT